MNLSQKVLKLLINSSCAVSGENLAEQLKVSRNSVWKAVTALRNEGFTILADAGKGYMLSNDNKALSAAQIELYLDNKCDIQVFKSLASTNNHAKSLAEAGAPENTLIIAERQTEGKGRLGRSFFSPADSGIYLSLILRPQFTAENMLYITIAAAVAVSRAIDDVFGVCTQIKWVNDIFLDGKKICGILTEGSFNIETGHPDYAVLGIGINITKPQGDFPTELKDIAGFIVDKECTSALKSRLIAKITDNFLSFYRALHNKEYIAEYRSRSCIIGKTVKYTAGNTEFSAYVNDIDENARLVVTDEGGCTHTLSAGEVSVRI